MEKAPRSKGTIMLRYLQKAATFTITNNPHSPRGSAAERLAAIRGISGPIASIIPSEARHKKRNDDDAFNEEPTSPKVTCIGQIKHKKTAATKERKKKNKNKNRNKSIPSALTRFLSQRVRPDHEKKKEKEEELASAPALGQLRRFTSSRREALADFDWQSSDNEEGKEDGMSIYHSAPLVLGGDATAAEHKEAGLWRRRSIAALMPLQVNK